MSPMLKQVTHEFWTHCCQSQNRCHTSFGLLNKSGHCCLAFGTVLNVRRSFSDIHNQICASLHNRSNNSLFWCEFGCSYPVGLRLRTSKCNRIGFYVAHAKIGNTRVLDTLLPKPKQVPHEFWTTQQVGTLLPSFWHCPQCQTQFFRHSHLDMRVSS